MKCLEYIDAICYINLAHRTDRNEHILNEIHKFCKDNSKIHRIDAIKKDIGILGCGLSHAKTLEYVLSHPEWNRVLILEDDFTFKSNLSQEINDKIVLLIENAKDMDVGFLSHNHTCIKYSNTSNDSIKKVIFSQTASSYIVTKEYTPTLLENMKTGLENMQIHGVLGDNCVDVHWKSLQLRDNWYTLFPAIGHQYDNFSDIQKIFTRYGC